MDENESPRIDNTKLIQSSLLAGAEAECAEEKEMNKQKANVK